MKGILSVLLFACVMFSAVLIYAGEPDVASFSYNGVDYQGFEFYITGDEICQAKIRVKGRGEVFISDGTISKESKVTVEIADKGNYFIKLDVNCKEAGKNKSSHVYHYNFPVKVGDLYFFQLYDYDLENGNIGQGFIVYPLFNYPISRSTVDIDFAGIKKTIPLYCSPSPDYCITGIAEFSPEEFEYILGDTYTCFKVAGADEGCWTIKYHDFIR